MLLNSLHQKLQKWRERDLIRKLRIKSQSNEDNIIYLDRKRYINFASNDYLGLAKHPEVRTSFARAAETFGFGSGASAMISGYSMQHHEFELRFAQWLQVDKAILFNSGYHANIGIFNALLERSDAILSDKLCHSSILEGIRLSRARHYRYQHCDIAHLKKLSYLKQPKLYATEGIFSMEGNIAPIQEIVSASEQHQSSLVIDDAHGIGVLGKKGRGVYEHFNINPAQLACLVLPLGKAFNGLGAIVAGRNEVVESVLQFSNSYRYSTALPAAVCAALLSSLNVVIEEQWRRDQLKKNINIFNQYALEKKLNLISRDETPIRSLMIGDIQTLLSLQAQLLSKGWYVAAIRPPTVPEGCARLRISLNSLHTEAQIMLLLDDIDSGLKL